MPPSVDWRIGSGAAGPDMPDLVPGLGFETPASPPARAPIGLGRLLLFSAIYLATIVAAGLFGLSLGRRAEVDRVLRAVIENQLAIEGLAWQSGDQALFLATLDPRAPEAWRAEQVERFMAHAPTTRAPQLLRFELLRRDWVRCLVASAGDAPGSAARAEPETRYYRLVDGTWQHSAPPPATDPPEAR